MKATLFSVFYRWVMPVITFTLLILVSSLIKRESVISPLIDLIARIWFCLLLCLSYILWSDFDKYENTFPFNLLGMGDLGFSWIDVSSRGFIYVARAIWIGIASTIVTWMLIKGFLPIFESFAWILAFLNGLIFSLPLFFRRDQDFLQKHDKS